MTKKVKHKSAITILAVIGFVLNIVKWLIYITYFNQSIDRIIEYSSYDVNEYMRYMIIMFSMDVVIRLMFILYIQLFCGEKRGTILFIVICILIAFRPIMNIILTEYFSATILLDLIPVIIFILLAISALNGTHTDVFTIIATVIMIIIPLENYYWFSSIVKGMVDTGHITFYLAMLLYGVSNRIPTPITVTSRIGRRMLNNMTAEQALWTLEDQLNCGQISEEEYNAERVKIISSL